MTTIWTSRIGKRNTRRLYAVSARGVGIFSNTFATSRRGSIERFQHSLPDGSFALDWIKAKSAGYRTVCAAVEVTNWNGHTRRSAKR